MRFHPALLNAIVNDTEARIMREMSEQVSDEMWTASNPWTEALADIPPIGIYGALLRAKEEGFARLTHPILRRAHAAFSHKGEESMSSPVNENYTQQNNLKEPLDKARELLDQAVVLFGALDKGGRFKKEKTQADRELTVRMQKFICAVGSVTWGTPFDNYPDVRRKLDETFDKLNGANDVLRQTRSALTSAWRERDSRKPNPILAALRDKGNLVIPDLIYLLRDERDVALAEVKRLRTLLRTVAPEVADLEP